MERRRKIAAARTMHGHRIAPRGSAEYKTWWAWAAIRKRCYNHKDKAYPHYGGRGIQVCSEWFDYVQFFADMGPAPVNTSIDRIDNDGNYEPGNCRWATKQEQARNRRTNRLIVIDGQERTLAEWSDVSGVKSSTIRARIKYGMTGESLINPVTH